jgi:hypothetical protein
LGAFQALVKAVLVFLAIRFQAATDGECKKQFGAEPVESVTQPRADKPDAGCLCIQIRGLVAD